MDINRNNPFVDCKGIKQKREVLKALSKGAKAVVKMTGGELKVNDVLIDSYKDKNHKEFSTFLGWKRLGFTVQKGAKAFCVWSTPLKTEVKNKDGEKKEEETEYFGIAFLFSNYQVKKEDK